MVLVVLGKFAAAAHVIHINRSFESEMASSSDAWSGPVCLIPVLAAKQVSVGRLLGARRSAGTVTIPSFLPN